MAMAPPHAATVVAASGKAEMQWARTPASSASCVPTIGFDGTRFGFRTSTMFPSPIPAATYRLQLNAGFTLANATEIVDYLNRLGISHCYASSYFKAVPGSKHGYDVADPRQLNPEIGDRASYDRWIETLRAHGMGHIIDLVPNHMGIAKSTNPWWQDVLENGESSRYADVFDIDWEPLKSELDHKVLLPVL